MAKELSQRTLTNMGYFQDEDRRVYYLCVSKNGKKIYNFDDLVEFVDVAAEPHVVDDQPIGAYRGAPQDDVVMQDDDHEDGQGSRIGAKYGNQSSIIIMLQNMHVKQGER